MNDNLDQLTDAELSECFAVEVAGHKPGSHFCDTNEGDYAESADKVLPWLEKIIDAGGYWRATANPAGFSLVIDGEQHPVAATLPRAICIALIRAKRAAK